MEEFTFEKLQVWHKARTLVKEVYALIDKLPSNEKYGLCNQLSRAIISVPSNIAEGCGRPSLKERLHFYEIAYGSLMESYAQIVIACDLGMVSESDFAEIKPMFVEISRMISGLRKSLQTKLKQTT